MSTCQHFKTTFKYNLTCIFLSLRAKLKKPLCPRTPCRRECLGPNWDMTVFHWIEIWLCSTKLRNDHVQWNMVISQFGATHSYLNSVEHIEKSLCSTKLRHDVLLKLIINESRTEVYFTLFRLEQPPRLKGGSYLQAKISMVLLFY